MGQAKNRGDFAARQKEAIESGRVKVTDVTTERPVYVHPGYKPSLVNTLVEVANQLNISSYSSSSKPAALYHNLSRGAEQTVEELEMHPDLRPTLTSPFGGPDAF